MPSSDLDYESPIELLMGTTATHPIPHKVFVCVCFVHDHGKPRGRLDMNELKCVFVGYSVTKKGYKCYHRLAGQIFISMDVTFRKYESFKASLLGGVLRKSRFPYHNH